MQSGNYATYSLSTYSVHVGYSSHMKRLAVQKKIGLSIREVREKQGISQEKLGFKTGLHRTYIGSVERGERNISIENIVKIARALGMPAYELIKKANL